MAKRPIALAAAAVFGLSFVAAPTLAQEKKVQKAKTQKAKSQKAKRVAQPSAQRHQCQVGPYEKQTRLVMETVKNKPVYLAYWSSNGPFHCSFETWPGDGRANWVDSKAGTVINLISGTMLIERNGDKYFVHAREVDRMPYCGTAGLISGVLMVPVKKGPCDWKETSSEEAGALKNEAPTEEGAPEQPSEEPAPSGSSAATESETHDPG